MPSPRGSPDVVSRGECVGRRVGHFVAVQDRQTHIKASAKGPVGALLKKETQKCKHHEATAQRYEMEFVPFIVDMHGAHGPIIQIDDFDMTSIQIDNSTP